MNSDQQLIDAILSRDDSVWISFYEECRDRFIAYFRKKYPNTTVDLFDLYHDAIMAVWSQIIEGRQITVKLSTYVISVGINKMHEMHRNEKKKESIKTGLGTTPTNFMTSKGVLKPLTDIHDIDDYQEKLDFVKEKIKELKFPCDKILQDTWYYNMTDEEILADFEGYFKNTNVIKSRRFKCHKALKNMYKAWLNAHN